jgi:hypothetical protein
MWERRNEDIQQGGNESMRTVFAATCFATALAVAGVGAQTTGQQYGQQQDRDRDKTISITGCLQSGEEAGSFVLAVDRSEYQRAMQQAGIAGEFAQDRQPRTTTGEPGAVGTTGADRDRDKEKIHLTDVPADVNLQDKVNQQVRVSGSLEMKDRGRDRAADTTAHTTHPTGAPTGTAGERHHRDRDDKKKAKLDVASVQVLSQTCPQQDAR